MAAVLTPVGVSALTGEKSPGGGARAVAAEAPAAGSTHHHHAAAVPAAASRAAKVWRWSDRATWGGRVPAKGATVTIPAGRTVTLDVSPPELGGLKVDGNLVFAEKSLRLRSKWIVVHGKLQVGTAAKPHRSKAVITLTENNPKANIMSMGPKVLGVMGRGVLELHGAVKTSWVRLGANAPRGARTLTLDRPVNWVKGDRLVLASTDFEAKQTEQLQVSSVSGRVVRLAKPLTASHWGKLQKVDGRTLDERAEVGLLTRNVVVEGDAASERRGFGGQVMIMKGAKAHVEGVSFYRMGKLGELRRYPIHFHMAGNAKGSYVRNSAIDHSFNRGITIHGTHNVLLSGNVIHDVVGHGVFLEDGIETGNQILNNLSVRTHRPKKELRLLPSDTDNGGPAAFWITNPNNVFRGNVAAASDGIGFWFALPEHPTGLSTTSKVWPQRTVLREFSGNVAHSNGGDGLHADGGPKPDGTLGGFYWDPRAKPSNPQSAARNVVLDRFTSYKNRGRGAWMRGARATIKRSVFADQAIGATFASSESGVADSLFVGESDNKGTPGQYETKGLGGRSLPMPWDAAFPIRGFEFYDGTVFAVRSHFAGYTSNSQRPAGAMGTLRFSAFPLSSTNWVSGLTFGSGVNRVQAEVRPTPKPKTSEDGYRTAAFLDIDGSVTGERKRYVSMNHSLLTPGRCRAVTAWNSSVCSDPFVSSSFYTAAGDHPGSVTVTGAGAGYVMQGGGDYEHLNLPANRAYSVAFGGHSPRAVTVVLAGYNAADGGGNGARTLQYAIPVGPNASAVPNYGGPPLPKVTSLAALAANTNWASYFVDGTTLHLKLRATKKGDYLSVRVNR